MLPPLSELLLAFFFVCWTLANLRWVDTFSQIQGRISGRFSLQEPSSTLSFISLPSIHLQKEMVGVDGAEEGPLLSFHLLWDHLGPQRTRRCAWPSKFWDTFLSTFGSQLDLSIFRQLEDLSSAIFSDIATSSRRCLALSIRARGSVARLLPGVSVYDFCLFVVDSWFCRYCLTSSLSLPWVQRTRLHLRLTCSGNKERVTFLQSPGHSAAQPGSRERDGCWGSVPFLLFTQSWTPIPRGSHLGWVFPPQLSLSGNIPIDMPRGVYPWWF